ncbi:MAG: chorismate mutase [Chloroflexota bacterium]
MLCRGVRGAISVEANTREAILGATRELLRAMMKANGLEVKDMACAIFTTTADLNAEFPAAGARELGWNDVPLLCGQEMEVPGALPRCLRVLLLANTSKRAEEMAHVYLKEAQALRPPAGEGAKK